MRRVLFLMLSLIILAGCAMTEEDELFQKSNKQNTIYISAATSLEDALPEVITAFEKKHPYINVEATYASSGQLASKIQQGAPVDLFLSANYEWVDVLNKEGLIIENSLKKFIGNNLVLIANADSEFDLLKLEDLKFIPFDKLVLGDPVNVPAGDYAKEAMESVGLWEDLKDKYLFLKDVHQVVDYVESNKAELGIVYASDTHQNEQIRVIREINKDLHSPIQYYTGITSYSTNHHDAETFIDYLQSEQTAKIFESYGFKKLSAKK